MGEMSFVDLSKFHAELFVVDHPNCAIDLYTLFLFALLLKKQVGFVDRPYCHVRSLLQI